MKKTLIRILCFALSVIILISSAVTVTADDTYLYHIDMNYCTAVASSLKQAEKVYAHVAETADCRYLPRLYDIMFRGQYRLSVAGGDKWPYYNEGDFITEAEDNVLGKVPIYEAKGCNSYARYATQYIRGKQGSTYKIATELGKPTTYIPTTAEIKAFIEKYIDIGERVLTCYWNDTYVEIHPHSLVFLGEDPEKEGFWFICQDGDTYGQTLRYITYEYLQTRLRYFENFDYSLAVGDNTGKDTYDNSNLLVGKTYFPVLQDTFHGEAFDVTGYAIKTNKEKVDIQISIDGKNYTDFKVENSDLAAKIFPTYTDGADAGFSFTVDTSLYSPGKHTIKVVAQAESGEKSAIGNYSFTVSDYSYKAETPKDNYVVVNSGSSVQFKGWYYDDSGREPSFSYTLDDETKFIDSVSRTDIKTTHPSCKTENCGYDFSLSAKSLGTEAHNLTIYANDEPIATYVVVVGNNTGATKATYYEVVSKPKQVEFSSDEKVNVNGLELLVYYSDGSKKSVKSGFDFEVSNTKKSDVKKVTVHVDDLTYEYEITISDAPRADSIRITEYEKYVVVNERYKFEATVSPNYGHEVTWSSSDSSILISGDGQIYVTATGSATITASVMNSEGAMISDSVKVRTIPSYLYKIIKFFSNLRSTLFGI